MADKSSPNLSRPSQNGNFICGVVEGFYGRPWTTEQRKDLFQKMKKWGMDSYLYAPKDDYKHRAYWRELYTVEEADHLTGLITAARESGIAFYYALSPGLDISYSNTKEVGVLKRKLEQVSQFGCKAFALLFDDIEPEMSESDKEVFQSFAHAQVSVSNEVYRHLGQPRFMVCPTQYCAARAAPNVQNSEYLKTLGSKLAPEIDIMWTGPKVISQLLTVESIEEITDVLRRPPVIWDNLHANDYDQKRVFLGPYSGRSPDLIPKLRGVLTNPNCEYGANFIAIHTLAQWSRCNVDGKRDPSINDCVSADIKLETETEDGVLGEDDPANLTPNMYHPRRALRNAINDWLVEFSHPRPAWGPIVKPLIMTPALPVPTINRCVSHTTLTTSTTTVNQLQALAEVCSNATPNDSLQNPPPGPQMNSLLSDKKVIVSSISLPSTTPLEPMDCNHTPTTSPAHEAKSSEEMELENTPSATRMQVEATNSVSDTMIVETNGCTKENAIMYEDLALLCDLFYLPFEHGGQGIQLLQEFNWLKTNAHLLLGSSKNGADTETTGANKPEIAEWFVRATKLEDTSNAVNSLFQRLTYSVNRELLYDLYPYVWDMRGVVSLLNSYVKWLALSHFPKLMTMYTTGTYTWFSKGWKESFMSGEQEPWVFRGGLTSDLQRLMPVDSSNDLFSYKAPETPSACVYTVRPYTPADEKTVYEICRRTCGQNPEVFAELPDLPGDKFVGSFLLLSTDYCFVVEDDSGLIGYALATIDSRQFYKKVEASWLTEMCAKYPKIQGDVSSITQSMSNWFHTFKGEVPDQIHSQHPSMLCCSILTSVVDQSVTKRLITCLLAALRTNGSFGVHVPISAKDPYSIEFYAKLGFVEVCPGLDSNTTYYGRCF